MATRSATPTFAQGLLGDIASGQSTTNPFLQQQINNAISGAVNKATSQYALGGRLGSAAFAGALGSGITGAAAPILAQQVEADRARQMQAANQLISAEQQNRAQALQAAGQLAGTEQQARAQQLQAAGQLVGAQQQNLAQQLQAAGLSPQLASQRFTDLAALQGVGAQQRALSQAEIQAQQDYINELNAAQQARLAARVATGLTPATPTQTTTAPGRSALAGAAGGALTGAALGSQIGAVGGPMGALVGAGLGTLGICRRPPMDMNNLNLSQALGLLTTGAGLLEGQGFGQAVQGGLGAYSQLNQIQQLEEETSAQGSAACGAAAPCHSRTDGRC